MKGWGTAKLGQVLARAERFEDRDEWTEYPFAGTYSFARGIFVGERKVGSSFKLPKIQRIKAGDFVYCKIMAWEGAFGLVPDKANDCVMSGAFVAYEIDTSRLEPLFLDLYFKIPRNWKNLGGQSSGTNVRRQSLHPKQFEGHEIPLPPLAEQRRIVARIEALAAQIDEAKRLRQEAVEEAEAIFDSFLKAMFESSGWPSKPLPDVADLARGKFAHRPRNEPRFYGGEYPFIQIGDLSSSDRYVQGHSQTLNADGLAISRMFPKGTVAIAITGATIGVTRILGFDSCFPDSIVGIQAKTERTIPEFIYLAVEHAKQAALAEATQTTQPNINLGNLERLMVHIPPLPEQRRIVAELDALQAEVDALKRLQAETAAELDALLPAILDRAFKGEL